MLPETVHVLPNHAVIFTHHALDAQWLGWYTGLSVKPLCRGGRQVGLAFWADGVLHRMYSRPRTEEELTVGGQARYRLACAMLGALNAGRARRVLHQVHFPFREWVFGVEGFEGLLFCPRVFLYQEGRPAGVLCSGSDLMSVVYAHLKGIQEPDVVVLIEGGAP